MSASITMVIIDSDRGAREAITAVVRPFADTIHVVGSVDNFDEGMKIIRHKGANIVILEVKDLEAGTEQVHAILANSVQTSVIVISAEKNPEWILKLMRAGAAEYLLSPVVADELVHALAKVGRFWFSKQPESVKEGKVIAVYYPTGGVGVTSVTVNLAASLAAETVKVALVDLNLFAGDISTFLDVNPSYTLSSVTSNIARLDANFLMSVMTRHSSGPYVLTEPIEVEEAVNITPEQVTRLMEFLKSIFDFVVVDCGGHLAGCNLAVFENADLVLFTTVLSLPAIKTAKRYLVAMERKGMRKDRLKLVVNRYLPKADIQIKDAERVLSYQVFLAIPNEYENIISSINKGVPVVKLLPRSQVARSFQRLAELVAEPPK